MPVSVPAFPVSSLLQNVLLAMALGALIGVEREAQEQRKYAGIRTLAILAGAGPLAVAVDQAWGTFVFTFLYLLFAGIVAVSTSLIRFVRQRETGLTTAATVFAVGLSSILIGHSRYFEAVAIGLIIALLLGEKQVLQRYLNRFSQDELTDALQFLFLAAVLLPLTPDATFFGFVNPRTILVLIVAILSLQFLSFVALRLYGKQGFHVSAVLGGAVNSTAAVLSIANHSTEGEMDAVAADGVLLSVTGSLMRNIVVIAVFSTALAGVLLPAFAAAIAVGFVVYRFMNTDHEEGFDVTVESPFSFRSAFLFGVAFLGVLAVIHGVQTWFGATGFLASSFAGGVASSMSVIASALSLLSNGSVELGVAGLGILLAVCGSVLTKLVLLFVKARPLYRRAVLPLVLVLAVLLAVFFLV